jgi:hypothetical protein
MLLAYCEHAGLPMPKVVKRPSANKWVAEDTFVMTALRLLWKNDGKAARMFRLARGKRIYAIWSAQDPLPSLAFLFRRYLPGLIATAWSAAKKKVAGTSAYEKKGGVYEKYLDQGKSRG